MAYQEPLSRQVVAISISESADMSVLGLAEEHLRDAMAEIARHLLAMGARLVYGGDLREFGFTELLFELVARHRRDSDVGDSEVGVLNFLAWPVHRSKSASEIRTLAEDLAGIVEFRCLDRQGRELAIDGLNAEPVAVSEEEWLEGLSALRNAVTEIADARVVLGGRTAGFRGRMPGIAEEALAALGVEQPIFLLGGFGGCARDIAEQLGLLRERETAPSWTGANAFRSYDVSSLKNGLTDDENRTLARTAHVDEAVVLILRGLMRGAARQAEAGGVDGNV